MNLAKFRNITVGGAFCLSLLVGIIGCEQMQQVVSPPSIPSPAEVSDAILKEAVLLFLGSNSEDDRQKAFEHLKVARKSYSSNEEILNQVLVLLPDLNPNGLAFGLISNWIKDNSYLEIGLFPSCDQLPCPKFEIPRNTNFKIKVPSDESFNNIYGVDLELTGHHHYRTIYVDGTRHFGSDRRLNIRFDKVTRYLYVDIMEILPNNFDRIEIYFYLDFNGQNYHTATYTIE